MIQLHSFALINSFHLPNYPLVIPSAATMSSHQKTCFKESYSLWFVPPPSCTLFKTIDQEIYHLASHTSCAAPIFIPHVTLLGGISSPLSNVLQISKNLASQLHSFDIILDRVSYGTIFHQCVYILCKNNDDIMQAGNEARQAFFKQVAPELLHSKYMPHMSLLYSNIEENERKEIAEREQAKVFAAGGDHHFTADSFQLWYTPVEDTSLQSWKLIEEFKFPC